MSFTAPRFTDEGKMLQAKAQAGTALKFTKMQLGDGELGSQAIAAMTGLVNPLITVGISSVKAGSNYATVKSNFSNSKLTTGFYWREIGVFAENPEKPNDRNSDILYCYANAGSLAEYIPAAGSEIVEKIISIPCIIGDAENVSAEVESGIYATKEELKEHIDNKNNPHNVTAKQIGAFTDESLTKETILNKVDVLDIKHGGTGKATKKEAFDNLAFLGNNPISSTDEDTPQKWGELGSGYAWFYTADLMINQPYPYMFVISYYNNDSGSVFQTGCEQKSGTVYYRTGNRTGWLMSWTPLLSTKGGTMSGQIYMNNLGIVFNKDADWDNGNYFSINAENDSVKIQVKRNGRNRMFYFNNNATKIDQALQMWWYDDGKEHYASFFGEHNKSLLATTIQNLLKGGDISVVKSVQRGTVNRTNNSKIEDYYNITISAVNTNKSILIINGLSYTGNSGASSPCLSTGKILNSTTIAVSPTWVDNSPESCGYKEINWQVVEYY